MFHVGVGTPLQVCPGLVGGGLANRSSKPIQSDPEEFQQIVRQFACTALNTWSQAGIPARTFIPAAFGDGHGTQIDFMLSRGRMVDGHAKQAAPFTCPIVPATGCRHLPVQCSIKAKIAQESTLSVMCVKTTTPSQTCRYDNLDGVMKACWQQCMDSTLKAKRSGLHMSSTRSEEPLAIHE